MALPYPSALHISLARVQGFLLMVTTHNFTTLKENGMTEDIFIKFRAPAGHCWSVGGRQLIMDAFEIKSQRWGSIFTFCSQQYDLIIV